MDILLTAATSAEIAPLTKHISISWQQQSEHVFMNGNNRLHFLITGIGMVATTYALTKIFQQQKFDLVLQAGIAGSFNRDIQLGEVVLVEREIFGDLGAEDGYNFLDIYELGLADGNDLPFQNKQLIAPAFTVFDKLNLRKVSSLSINTVSGTSFTATARFEKFGCDLESMEGAAFHYVCLKERVAFTQIRSISNYVEAREKEKWRIKDAVDNLNEWLHSFLNSL